QEQDKSIRTVKSISNNVLEAEVYYSSFNLLYFWSDRKALHKPIYLFRCESFDILFCTWSSQFSVLKAFI
ncbi:hypothetical protein BW157_08565, partial [Streptococcus pneumoniae]|nr:hypothetical protein [Streptococcus pneumoniae]